MHYLHTLKITVFPLKYVCTPYTKKKFNFYSWELSLHCFFILLGVQRNSRWRPFSRQNRFNAFSQGRVLRTKTGQRTLELLAQCVSDYLRRIRTVYSLAFATRHHTTEHSKPSFLQFHLRVSQSVLHLHRITFKQIVQLSYIYVDW